VIMGCTAAKVTSGQRAGRAGGSVGPGLSSRWALSLVAMIALSGCSGTLDQPSDDTRTAAPTPQRSSTSSPATSAATSAASSGPAPSSPAPSGPAPSSPGSQSPTTKVGKLTATDVATGLTSPWGLVALKDGSTLVSERDTGKILHVVKTRTTEVTRLSAVDPGGEGGLLGLAMTPDERTVFAYFTAAQDNRIVSMSWDGSKLGHPRTILSGIPKGLRHNGGRLVVGPDGYLYVGTGETGDESLSQNKRSLGGKILRITFDGKPAPQNPFDNEVYSYGHRNVQGLAFDDHDRLWASEFGDQTWDELNLITKGGNYGWPEAEGSAKIDGLTNPKVVWRTSQASPSGLAYWRGELWMAALRGERLWEIPLDGTKTGEPRDQFANKYGRLRSVTVSADGQSLLLTASNTDSRGVPKPGDDRLMRVTG
jgi:glucose/arabinose dehydrogenase